MHHSIAASIYSNKVLLAFHGYDNYYFKFNCPCTVNCIHNCMSNFSFHINCFYRFN